MITFDIIMPPEHPGPVRPYQPREVTMYYRFYIHAKSDYEKMLNDGEASKSELKAAKKRMDKAKKTYEKAKKKFEKAQKKEAKNSQHAQADAVPVYTTHTEQPSQAGAPMSAFYDATYSIPLVASALILCAVAIHYFGRKRVKE